MSDYSPDHRTLAFRGYVAPARARPAIWRLLVGLVLCLAVYLGWVFGGLALLALWDGGLVAGSLARMANDATPQSVLLILASFLGMALGPMLAVRWLHRRRVATLFGPGARVLRDFVLAVAVVGAIYGASLLIWAWWFDAVPGLAPGQWLVLLPLALLGLLIQTGAEELVFRGYLQQQLAARFRARGLWMLLPSVIFGAVHYDPVTAGANVWLFMLAAGLFGLAAADLTATTGSLGAAWGLHFANNFIAVGVLASEGSLSGLALYKTPYGADSDQLQVLILADLVVLALAWGVCRRVLQR